MPNIGRQGDLCQAWQQIHPGHVVLVSREVSG